VFSGKRVGKRIAPEMVLPVCFGVVLFFALLISYPWPVLTFGTVLYLLSLPFGPISYREYQRKDAAAAEQASAPQAAAQPRAQAELPAPSTQSPRPTTEHPPDPDRPARLN
jgi:CDP-diacylglycerol--serine O-phosphatidyltransferase